MDGDLLSFIKNVQIDENLTNQITITIETDELLKETNKLIILVKLKNEIIKTIEIRRR